MRKLYVIAVLAGCLSVLGNPAIAAVEDCEELKGNGGSKGLYGMCVAYWNSVANQENSGSETRVDQEDNRFLDRYNEIRDRVGGPPMPGLESEFDCPCWDVDFLAEITLNAIPDACGENTIAFPEKPVATHDIAFFDNFDLQLMAGSPFPGIPTECSVMAAGAANFSFPTTADQTEDCVVLLMGLKGLFDDAGIACTGW